MLLFVYYLSFFFIHFPYSDIWADIFEIEFYIRNSLFVQSLWYTYHILSFITFFAILKVIVILNGQNPEGFSSVSPTCLLHGIIFAIARCLCPEL